MMTSSSEKDKLFSQLLSTVEKGKVLPDKQFLNQLRDRSAKEFEAYAAESKTNSQTTISIWRIIMKSRITKLAAAVFILIIAGVGVGVLSQIAKRDVVLSISFDKLIWKSNEVPLCKADLSHRGKHELVRLDGYELEYDGTWYVDSRKRGTSDIKDNNRDVFQPDTDYRDIEFGLDHRWLSKRSGKPLKLIPGRHRIQLAFNAKVKDGTTDESVRIVSNFAEFRILESGKSATEEDWLEIAAGGYPGLKYSEQQVAAMHLEKYGKELSSEELAKFYYDKAFELSQRGGDPFELGELAESALAVEKGDVARLRLYSILGDAYQRQTKKYTSALWGRQRRIAAMAFFAGLAEGLRNDLPAEKPQRSGVFKYYDGSKELKGTRFAQLAIAVARDPDRMCELMELRQTLTLQIVSMYARTPDAFEELHELAMEYIGDETAANQLVEAAKAYRENSRSPIPVISLQYGGEAGGGEAADTFKVYDVNGVRIEAAFMPDKTEILLGEPLFITFCVKNSGHKPYSFFIGGDNRGSVRHNSFHITAVDVNGLSVKDPYSYDNMGGRGNCITLEHGESYAERLYLGHWCAFEKSGGYTVTCERTLNEHFSGHTQIRIVVSFEINITPYDEKKMRRVIDELGEQIFSGVNLGEASLALSAIHDEAVVAYLAKVMESKADWQVKNPAIDGLAQFSTQAAIDGLIVGLKDSDEAVRTHAARALANMKKKEYVINALVKELGSEQVSVRALAVRALGTLGLPQCVEVLNRYTDTEDFALRLSVVKGLVALKQAVQASWLTPIIKATTNINDQKFHDAIRILRLYGGEQAARGLVSCLQFGEPSLKNSYNMFLILAIESSPGGPKYYYKYHHDPNIDGSPEQIEENRKILEALKSWLQTQENMDKRQR